MIWLASLSDMTKLQKHPQTNNRRPSGLPAQSGAVQQTQTHVFQGPTPPPEIMERYEALVPGTAQRLFKLAEDESLHRRTMESQANTANIFAQEKQLSIADYQSRATFKSDSIGQIAGILVSLSCVAGAVFLAMNNHEWVAGGLAAIPTAAVIQAFFAKRPHHPQQSK